MSSAAEALSAGFPAPTIVQERKMDSKDEAEQVIKSQEAKADKRRPWERSWQDITERLLPNYSDFTIKRMDGQARTDKIYDGTPLLALERFAAAFESYLVPRTMTWHKQSTLDDDLNADKEVAVYLDKRNKVLFNFRNQPFTGFATNVNEVFTGLGSLGTGTIYSEGKPGYGITYRSIPLAESFISQNAQGIVDNFDRRFEYSHAQAAEKFGYDNLPEAIRNKVQDRPDEMSEYIHCVKPRDGYRPYRRSAMDAPFLSTYVSVEAKRTIGMGGYWTFPYMCSRYVTSPRETYGRSPAFFVLSDIKMVNEMSRDGIRILNRQADPPLLVFDDGVIEKVSMRNGAINMGGVNEQGQPLVHAMQFGGNVNALDKELAERRNLINTAFLVTLFQVLIEHPRMSATEVLERAKEKGALLAPTAGRQITDLLDPLVARDVDLLTRMGAMPEMPRKLLRDGRPVRIVYDNPLTRMARSEEGAGFLRTMEILAPAAQVDPTILDIFDMEEAARGLAEIFAVNPKWLRSPEDMAALRQGRAQAAQAQQLLQAVPAIAQALERTSQAQLNAAQAKA